MTILVRRVDGQKYKTDDSEKKWAAYKSDQEMFKSHKTKKRKLNDSPVSRKYIKELHREESKYYAHKELAKAMYRSWKGFNLEMRNHLFGKLLTYYDTALLNKMSAPFLSITGMVDGIIPPYLWPDSRDVTPPGLDHVIVPGAAHMVQVDEPEYFSDAVLKWLQKNERLCETVKKDLRLKNIASNSVTGMVKVINSNSH